VTHTCIQDGWPGIGNIATDPLFFDPDGPDDLIGTEDDDLRLAVGSPCIDAGDNWAVPDDVGTDLGGHFRFMDDPATPDTGAGTPPIVDMGAHEFGPDCDDLVEYADCNDNGVADVCDLLSWASKDCNLNSIPDECDIAAGTSEDCNTNGVPDACDPGSQNDCNGNGVLDMCDLFHGTSTDCNANDTPDECDITGASSDDCNVNGVPDSCDILEGTSEDCHRNDVPDECESAPGLVVFVDDDAMGGLRDGSTWANAFVRLADALHYADCAGVVNEIRVAEGTYIPVDRAQADVARTEAFMLRNNLTIRGGYQGLGSRQEPGRRDVSLFKSVLSGDLRTEGADLDDAYHVVVGASVDQTAVLDGFTVTSGHAAGSGDDRYGGGMIIDAGSPMVANCSFIGNRAANGGGALSIIDQSAPVFTNCVFDLNSATYYGGAIYIFDSTPTIINSTIAYNSTGLQGGGMGNYFGSRPVLTNSIIFGNTAPTGPGVHDDVTSTANATYCCIQGGWPGVGNVDADPLFVDPNGPDGLPGTADDDMRLQFDSPCVNAGTNGLEELSTTDLDGHARVLCDVVDMGAYEYGIGDYECDGDVDLADFLAWHGCMNGPAGDGYANGCEAFDREFDGDIDLVDFAVFQQSFDTSE
jgi:hypothetical protein